ncbi:hypothetical protein Cgig2_009339 [Carnegiea gigantea]|uniref:Ubiquitin-like protease family profile domain-containing protein n=1 Tax=Carnegiea gigantea TaxID=171969 RepID=A0A9Q1GM51_9CARY|nr:hypothetical protein Cgig2_009339 [Carnegiea gigantea]
MLKGLIYVVPKKGAGDNTSEYCIGVVSIIYLGMALHAYQQKFPTLCWSSVFLKYYDKELLRKMDVMPKWIWDAIVKGSNPPVHYKKAMGRAFMHSANFHDALSWEVDYPTCPQQENWYDCGVFMMMFMDLLSLKGKGIFIEQGDMRLVREKLLVSLLNGEVCHFPPDLVAS